MMLLFLTMLVAGATAQGFPSTCPAVPLYNPNATHGVCPDDFTIIGPTLEAVHESVQAPTGLAVDHNLSIYLTYPRNMGATPVNVVKATSFMDEVPWPNAAIQNCTDGQDAAECFINVQNVVLDALGQLWIVDSGIPPGAKSAVIGGAKIMSFNQSSGELISTYLIPEEFTYDYMNANDVRINNTLGTNGYAFITDESNSGSLLAINLENGCVTRRLHNTTVTRADANYVGSYNGEPIYIWNGTNKSYATTGSDGIALASGNVYWGVLASRRFFYISQETLVNTTLSDEDVLAAVRDPGELGSEQAGFTADDRGRVYMMASEQNAIYYVDTLQSEVTMEVNGVPPAGSGLVARENYVVKTLVRSGLIQHADSAAILDGWLYFCTNQLELSPGRQYGNVDNRRGPFRSYRTWIGRGPAV
ncbi:major royal jelly protein-domain-containing protein [Xylariales sp. AK1849]|nr:major royal jelly protein-domain-containing protein [Xylariales sp. AK1849]